MTNRPDVLILMTDPLNPLCLSYAEDPDQIADRLLFQKFTG
ncbi:MAG: hypothetical protein O7G87_17590 [bacterium]|nr:hypothetical protein [bacterium]